MRVFVTGVKGQLGYDVMNELEKQGLEGIGVDIDEMDITDADQVNKVIKEAAPDAVIHCAAYTAVDAAEDNEEICRKVNAQGTENIAKVCEELDIKMMYISTDYVFNGQGERPWEPDDKREPLNVYGQTKYEGELAIEEHVKKFFTVRGTDTGKVFHRSYRLGIWSEWKELYQNNVKLRKDTRSFNRCQ